MHRSKVATAEPQRSFPERCLCSETSDVGRLVEKKHSEFGGFFFLTSHPVIEPGGRPGIAATTSYSAQEVAAQSSAGGSLFGHPQSHSPGEPLPSGLQGIDSHVCSQLLEHLSGVSMDETVARSSDDDREDTQPITSIASDHGAFCFGVFWLLDPRAGPFRPVCCLAAVPSFLVMH